MKDKIIDYIDLLEAEAMQNGEYFKQRNELYIENQKLKSRIEKAVEYIKQYGNLYCLKHQQFKKYYQYEELLNILNGRSDE